MPCLEGLIASYSALSVTLQKAHEVNKPKDGACSGKCCGVGALSPGIWSLVATMSTVFLLCILPFLFLPLPFHWAVSVFQSILLRTPAGKEALRWSVICQAFPRAELAAAAQAARYSRVCG